MQISPGFIEPKGDLLYWGWKGNTDLGWSIYTVFSGFQQLTSQFFHFCLLALLPTIQERLRQRGDDGTSWAWKRSIAYLPRFADERFRHHIQTAHRTPEDITKEL